MIAELPTSDDVAAAWHRGEFCLHYQPIVSLVNRRCVGGEALVRWQRGGELVPANEFIHHFEGTPLSGPLTYWVIERIAIDLGDWLRAGTDRLLSFNVPAEILGRGGLDLAGEKAGLTDVVDRLVVEITERSLPDQLGVDALNSFRLRAHRSKVAIDDAGLGHGNLVVLARLPLDIIKLDASVIDRIVPDGPLPEIAAQIASLAREGGTPIVAEGIEQEYQLMKLREAGVQYGQGWLFAKALPLEEFLGYFARQQ